MTKFDYLKERIGGFKIVMDGVMIKPPDLRSLIPLIIVILMLSLPVFAFSTLRFHDYWTRLLSSLLYLLLVTMTFTGMLWVSFTDPGIIP